MMNRTSRPWASYLVVATGILLVLATCGGYVHATDLAVTAAHPLALASAVCPDGPVNGVTMNYPTCTGPEGNGCIPPAGSTEVCLEVSIVNSQGATIPLQGEFCGLNDGQVAGAPGGILDVYKTQARAMQCGVVMFPEWESLGWGWGPGNSLVVVPMRVGSQRPDGFVVGSLRDSIEAEARRRGRQVPLARPRRSTTAR